MPPLNTHGIFYSMVEEVQNYMVLELRKFFRGQAPYNTKYPSNFIDPDFLYTESSPGVPTGGLNIVDEENFDDRRIPCIILTGFSGDSVELGLGQVTRPRYDTREPNPVMATPVRAASVVAGNLSSDFDAGKILDGVVLVAGDRILIKNQVNPAQNGVYNVSGAGAPTRASDFNVVDQFTQWSTIPITEGIINAARNFSQTSSQPAVLGTDPIYYDDRGLGTLEWDERGGAKNINVTYSIRTRTTSQRARLADLLFMAVADRRFIRGEIEKQSVYITPPFLRENGSSEEFTISPGTDMIYRVDYSSTFFTQWTHRLLKTEVVSRDIIPEGTLSREIPN